MIALGIYHTPCGKFLAFPCGCDGGDNLDAKRQKGSLAHPIDGKYLRPVWLTFETDYVFEDRPMEVEVVD